MVEESRTCDFTFLINDKFIVVHTILTILISVMEDMV